MKKHALALSQYDGIVPVFVPSTYYFVVFALGMHMEHDSCYRSQRYKIIHNPWLKIYSARILYTYTYIAENRLWSQKCFLSRKERESRNRYCEALLIALCHSTYTVYVVYVRAVII